MKQECQWLQVNSCLWAMGDGISKNQPLMGLLEGRSRQCPKFISFGQLVPQMNSECLRVSSHEKSIMINDEIKIQLNSTHNHSHCWRSRQQQYRQGKNLIIIYSHHQAVMHDLQTYLLYYKFLSSTLIYTAELKYQFYISSILLSCPILLPF